MEDEMKIYLWWKKAKEMVLWINLNDKGWKNNKE